MREKQWEGRNPGKDALRRRIWTILDKKNLAVGDPFYSIPDFLGAREAALRLAELGVWKQADVVECCPDIPQIPVRLSALQQGKKLYMAVPKLADEKCFVSLTADQVHAVGGTLEEAASWEGALTFGKPVSPEEMQPIDITVTGCVAVTPEGGRTGKGAGFSDLEFALLKRFSLISEWTPRIATVHDEMIVSPADLPLQAHDVPLTLIVTPTQVMPIAQGEPPPLVLDFDRIRADQIESIPILKKLCELDGIP